MQQAWRRAQMAWAYRGFPFADKCVNMTPPIEGVQQGKEWFLFAEDSARLFQTASIAQMQHRLNGHPDEVEIIQVGYRRTTGRQAMKLLDLVAMEVMKEDKCRKIIKTVGQSK